MLNRPMAGAHPPARLLIVDDEPMIREMLITYLSGQGYVCQGSGSAKEALEVLAQDPVDLVITDFHMPGGSGLELLQTASDRYPSLAFLLITAAADTQTAVRAMRDGAADFLIKPLELNTVLASVGQALDKKQQRLEAERSRQNLEKALSETSQNLERALSQMREASAETLRAMAIAIDVRAHDVAGHSERVSRYAVELGSRLGYSEEELARLEHGSFLHDVGKLGVPDAILNKPGALTPEETEIMRTHVRIGYDLVRQVPSLAPAAELILAHQEHYDGRGYPQGLKGDAIPLDARIFAVADALDAITSDRPYRRALDWSYARREISAQSGKQFDPQVVAVFLATEVNRWRALQRGPATH